MGEQLNALLKIESKLEALLKGRLSPEKRLLLAKALHATRARTKLRQRRPDFEESLREPRGRASCGRPGRS